MEKTLYYLHTLSALHIGIGQGSGVIDLPIAREKATALPQAPGSSIKGVLRNEYRPDDPASGQDYLALFGPETGDDASEYAGALAVGDGRLLALPVRSWKGTFAWATCPLILRRYQRDLNEIEGRGVPAAIPQPAENSARHASNSALLDGDTIYLEDLDLSATECDGTTAWANYIARELSLEGDLFSQRFLVLPDNLLDFLAETATEIRTRVRIDPATGAVRQGALWSEEYLPAETLLWGVLACDRARNKAGKDGKALLAMLDNKTIQLGGNATTGSGQTHWIKREARP